MAVPIPPVLPLRGGSGGGSAAGIADKCTQSAQLICFGARSPSGASRRRLPERANAPTQPRPCFARTRGCRRYRHRQSRLSGAPRAPVVVPAGTMPKPPGSEVTSPARRNRTRPIQRLSPVDVPEPSEIRNRLITEKGTTVNGKETRGGGSVCLRQAAFALATAAGRRIVAAMPGVCFAIERIGDTDLFRCFHVCADRQEEAEHLLRQAFPGVGTVTWHGPFGKAVAEALNLEPGEVLEWRVGEKIVAGSLTDPLGDDEPS